MLSSLKKIPACDSKNIQWITPQILISTETVNLESTYDESWGLSSELGDFKPGISSSPLARKYYICFCAGFSCTPHPGDIQWRSLCFLFIFALRVTFKWNFHIGSSLTKKEQLYLEKKVALLFVSVLLLVVWRIRWSKGTLSSPLCPQIQIIFMSKQNI